MSQSHGSQDIVAHPNYDEFWQCRNLRPQLKDIGCAVLVTAGWCGRGVPSLILNIRTPFELQSTRRFDEPGTMLRTRPGRLMYFTAQSRASATTRAPAHVRRR